jgi:protein TonB
LNPRLSFGSWAAIATIAVHVGAAAAVSTIRGGDAAQAPTVITVREVARKAPPPPPPLPTPPPPTPAPPAPAAKPAPPRPVAARRAAPAATPAPSAPAAAPAPVALGLTLGNAEGHGPAVAAPPPAEAPPPPKARTLVAAAPVAAGCTDPIVKPKPIRVVQPAFTQDAQDAGITGKVRIEITISATGEVTAARVIEGLGHGLDESALEAAKQSSFEPATRCGERVQTTFTIGMRFQR